MNSEIKAMPRIAAFLGVQAKIAAAFNFFISGMIIGLIYHEADLVPLDSVSVAVDLVITCLLTFTITAYFCRASLKSTKTAGILPAPNVFIRFLAKLFRSPLAFGVLSGLFTAASLFAVIAPLLALLKITALPFYPYVLLKSLSCMLLGSGVTLLELFAGMCKTE